ncbi:MAG: alanine:cation symporter family protein [Bacteroidales bacterium]|nr:alanine:cation symporter family protein [Bacteroidales bacterium]
MEKLNVFNNFLWDYVVILALLGCALWFTLHNKGVQFRMLKDMCLLLFCPNKISKDQGKKQKLDGKKEISSFGAFAMALAGRVGTGNLAGVASAIFIGGPGAVFWMWVVALLGAATAFVENTLAQLYKRKGKECFYGGPAYYIKHGLDNKWMSVLLAILITLSFGFAQQLVQSNTICTSISYTLGINQTVVGVIMAIITLLVVFGGIHRINDVSSYVVPFMAIAYIILAMIIVISHITLLPGVIALICKSAFGIGPAAGGMIGVAVSQGVRRGLFSNEAGEGSSPNIASTASVTHPVKQGLVQALGVFTDTLVICTSTAFVILLSVDYTSNGDGIILTTKAVEANIGSSGKYFVMVAIFLFAFTSVMANYVYAETNIRYLFKGTERTTFWLRLFTGAMVLAGSMMALQESWVIVDICMGIMTLINLIALARLSPQVAKLLKHYRAQRKQGIDPTFKREHMPEISDRLEAWD